MLDAQQLLAGRGADAPLLTRGGWPRLAPVAMLAIWGAFLAARGRPSAADKRQALWGVLSAALLTVLLLSEPEFRGWGDVYFFCGARMTNCTCSLRWNARGWYKALVLANSVLSASLGVQRLLVQLVLGGMLPGEEVVTRDAFASILFRLVPYTLNAWEQQWGAECSSCLYELPHFAIELIILLPCVQLLSSRMRVLALTSVNAALPPGHDGVTPDDVRRSYVPCVLRACWERRPEQRRFAARIRANTRVIAFCCLLCCLAAANALLVPLKLEDLILQHPTAALVREAPQWLNGTAPATAAAAAAHGGLAARRAAFFGAELGCSSEHAHFRSNLLKHHAEMQRMQEPAHRATIPLVEAALALMRLSTERFFVLLSLYGAFLLFHDHMPRAAARLVSLNARISAGFAKLVLAVFPAVAWAYGAGWVFSLLVSVMFWGGPLWAAYEYVRTSVCSQRIKALRPATAAEVERMGEQCAICWCPMVPGLGAPAAASGSDECPSSGVTSSSCGVSSQAGAPASGAACAAAAAVPSSAQPQLLLPAATGAAPEAKCAAAAAGATSRGQDSAELADAADAQAASAPGQAEGSCLPCGHSYHGSCLTQWLQQCTSQSTTPTCPMCQAALQLELRWHLPRWCRRGEACGQRAQEELEQEELEGNNYLLTYHPRLGEYLQDIPQFLAAEQVALLAELQDLRHQRQQLVGELQLRRQQLRELAGRQRQMEQQQQQEHHQQRERLLHELQLLRRARQRQIQLLQQAQAGDGSAAASAPTAGAAPAGAPAAAAGGGDVWGAAWQLADPADGGQLRQLEAMLERFLEQQAAAAAAAAAAAQASEPAARPPSSGGESGAGSSSGAAANARGGPPGAAPRPAWRWRLRWRRGRAARPAPSAPRP